MDKLQFRWLQGGRAHNNSRIGPALVFLAVLGLACLLADRAHARGLWAGAAKVEITGTEPATTNDPLYAKALVLGDEKTTVAIVTVDAVALGEIGTIPHDYLARVRARLNEELKIKPANVLINASHCHGVVCRDIEARTIQAVRDALGKMTPVKVGAGVGREDRIMENRRMKLKNGREADVRRAYALPPDEEVAGVGPVDPEIGVLRLDREDGRTLAVIYNFACHPILGVPSGKNTADLVGFASKAIEESLGEGSMALFLQGCAGDINPVLYKDVARPHDAEALGNRLGLSTLKALQNIKCGGESGLRVMNEVIRLPRADLAEKIKMLEVEQAALVGSLKGTSINLKTFIPLTVKYGLGGEYPSYDAHRYRYEKSLGREDLNVLDAENRKNMAQYVRNVHVMEALTRNQENLRLLKMHQAANAAAGKRTIDVEIMGLRIGDFVLVTFPGEPTVQIGLNIKQRSPHTLAFIAGCTNGYIYYAPTAEQMKNRGWAQEDSDCLLGPQWQAIYENKVAEILRRL